MKSKAKTKDGKHSIYIGNFRVNFEDYIVEFQLDPSAK